MEQQIPTNFMFIFTMHALQGKGVHVITTNEYLAKRDYTEIGKILEFLGVTVGFIYQGMEKET